MVVSSGDTKIHSHGESEKRGNERGVTGERGNQLEEQRKARVMKEQPFYKERYTRMFTRQLRSPDRIAPVFRVNGRVEVLRSFADANTNQNKHLISIFTVYSIEKGNIDPKLAALVRNITFQMQLIRQLTHILFQHSRSQPHVRYVWRQLLLTLWFPHRWLV